MILSELIFKVRTNSGAITLVPYLDDSKHELIEEIDVPEDEDPEEYCQLLLEEVDLGSMCETRTRY